MLNNLFHTMIGLSGRDFILDQLKLEHQLDSLFQGYFQVAFMSNNERKDLPVKLKA